MEFEDTDSIEGIEDNDIETADLSDEEFNKQFAQVEPEVADVAQSRDLNEVYKSNLGTDKKLDDPIVIKVDGQVYELDSLDEIRNLIERGTGVTKKFQKLAEDRKALEKQLAELGQTPNVEAHDDISDEVESIAQSILDSDYADNFTADMQNLDAHTLDTFKSNPEMLKALSIDYKSGFAQKIMPHIGKEMRVNGLSFTDAYVKIGKQQQAYQQKQTLEAPKANMLRAEPKAGRGKVSGELGKAGIDSMSDAEFNKYFANL